MSSSLPKLAYHLTTYEHAMKIIDSGFIDPAFSQGKKPVCWYVSQHKMTWAVSHVCQRQNCLVEQVVIFTVWTPQDDMKHSNKRGVYWCASKIPILEMQSAALWLQREERRIFIPRTIANRIRNHNYGRK